MLHEAEKTLQDKSKLSMTLQMNTDQLQFALNEAKEQANQMKLENKALGKVIETMEAEKIQTNASVDQMKRQIELLEKARDHKEKHCALLVQ
jgi:hypothetical protein